MPTIVTKTIKASGGDYTSLKAAIEAQELVNFGAGAGVLTGAADIVLRFECYDGVVDTATVKIDGFTTDATRYVEVYCPSGQGHTGFWSTSKYRIEVSDARAVETGSATCKHVRFKNILAMTTGAASGLDAFFHSGNITGSCDIRYVNCIGRASFSSVGAGAAFRGFSGADVAGTKAFYYVNCIGMGQLAPDSTATESIAFATFSNASVAEYMFNCLAVSADRGFRRRAQTRLKNSGTIGCRNGFIPTESTFHANSVAGFSSSDEEIFHSGGPADYKFRAPFMVNPIGLDFRLHTHDALGTRRLAGLGTDLSGDSDYPTDSSAAWPGTFNYDIAGNARTGSWSLGPSNAQYGTDQSVWWLWCGGVTNKTAKLLVRQASESHSVTLKYSTDSNFLSGVKTLAPEGLGNGRRLFTFTNLKPDTTYYYRPVVSGVDNTEHSGRFRTMPDPGKPHSFRLGFFADMDTGTVGQCARELDGSDPLYTVMGGDLFYENISSNNTQLYYDAYDTVMSAPLNQELFHHRPVAYTWDDHDFGPSNSDSTSPSRPAAYASYRDSTAHHTLPEGETAEAPIYHSFSIGRVRVIVLDVRSQRSQRSDPDTGSKTMLGSQQKVWLKSELLAAKKAAQFSLIISSSPWNANDNTDTWFGYQNERRELADFMQVNDIRNVAKLSGDRHASAIDDGSNDVYTTDLVGNGHVSMLAAPYEQSPVTDLDGVYSVGSSSATGQFGLITFADSGGGEMVVTYSCRRGPVEVVTLQRTYSLALSTVGSDAPLGTYANIVNAITKWLNRDGEAELADRIPEFIQMLEDDLGTDQEWLLERYSHRHGELFVVDSDPMILPTFVRELRALWLPGEEPIPIVNDEQWRQYVHQFTGGGNPRVARVTPLMNTWGSSEGARLEFFPAIDPDAEVPLEVDMLYVRNLDPLAQEAAGNALSLRHPNVYIYGVLVHAAPFYEHDERLPMFEKKYDEAIKKLKLEVERAQYGTVAKRRIKLPKVYS